MPIDGGWFTGLYPELESDAGAAVESLRQLRDQSADLIISSAFGGETGVVEMTPDAWRGIVDRRIASLERRFSQQTD